MKKTFSFLLFVTTFSLSAQILNVESLRKVNDTSRWSGNVNLGFTIIQNKNKIVNLTNKVHIQYKYEKDLILFINDFDLKKVNKGDVVNRAIQHLRYNRKLNKTISWELFAQSQFDEISEIDFRGLLGTGPRFKLSQSEDYKFYLGALSMYEYEKINNELEDNLHRDIRNSSYFSFSLYPNDNISIVSTTYYQPLYKEFSDYRVSNDTSVLIGIFKNLSFSVNFNYLFDANPAFGVPKEQYKFTNGLTYSFN